MKQHSRQIDADALQDLQQLAGRRCSTPVVWRAMATARSCTPVSGPAGPAGPLGISVHLLTVAQAHRREVADRQSQSRH